VWSCRPRTTRGTFFIARRIGLPYPYCDGSPLFFILDVPISFFDIVSIAPAALRNTKAKQNEMPKPRRSQTEENPRVSMIYELVYGLQAGFDASFDTGQGQVSRVGLPDEPINSFKVKVMKP
jgi:hypothetical protein